MELLKQPRTYQLKLSSKKLESGKCQIKFHAFIKRRKKIYGYLLTNADETLKSAVDKIERRLELIVKLGSDQNTRYYGIGKTKDLDRGLLIFEA